jgi:hypothetical protein
MKTLTKKELASLMKISSSTLQHQLNRLWYDELKKAGYKKRQKILTPKQISIIVDFWGEIEYDE